MLQKIEENVTDLYFLNNSSSDLNEILQVFEEYTIKMWEKSQCHNSCINTFMLHTFEIFVVFKK